MSVDEDNLDIADLDGAEEEKYVPSWVEWCERNAKPKKRVNPKVQRELTPWQKPGPMKKKDWKQFFEWAMVNAKPKEPKEMEITIPCEADYLPCGRPPMEIDSVELAQKIEELAKPYPRKVTPKHEFITPFYAYSPVIVWGKPPRYDAGRPFKPPDMPGCFPNEDIEGEYWAKLRFPIRPAALRARPTPRILNLAKLHKMPPGPPHCPIPAKTLAPLEVPPPPRKKFTPRGWKLHQIRLIYLSKPVSRPEFEYFYM
ncbi:uncharacterized protein LOC108603008 [Drosophila busckii]|uniref:uncharacterized protein LOC108603008 n=1 Tax=Drosophila busckii TaxID=30019 RepID=UPI00083EC451|nr:uncharacterized protein LOC108603008 [Drosophila busckii]